jgi:hypothetical protein
MRLSPINNRVADSSLIENEKKVPEKASDALEDDIFYET